MKTLIGIILAGAVPLCGASELVKACDIGNKPTRRVEVIRAKKIADTYVYYLRQNGKTRPFFDDPSSSRGSSVRVECVGNQVRALMVTGEFAANAVQGFVLTYSAARKIGRLDFAEKSRPTMLYLSPAQTIVVIPTHGYGETNTAFVAYRQAVSDLVATPAEGMNELPSPDGFVVIKLASGTQD